MTIIQALKIQRDTAQCFDDNHRLFPLSRETWQQLNGSNKKLGACRSPIGCLFPDKRLSKRQDDQKLYVPDVFRLCFRGRFGVKVVKPGHECFLVEQMEHLAAMELDGVDEVDCVVETR